MTDNKTSLQKPSTMPTQFDQEADLAQMADRVARAQAEHPDQDLKVSSQWWTPLTDLKADIQELDPETSQKVNDAARKVLESKFDPEVMNVVRGELQTLLSGKHNDLLKSVNDTIFANQDALAEMRERIEKLKAEGGQTTLPAGIQQGCLGNCQK